MDTLAEYEAWKAQQNKKGVGAATVVLGATEKQPDQLAGDLQLAKEFGKLTGNPVPPAPMVEQYRSVFQQAIEKTRAETILSSSPRLTEWLRNPENATLAKDDLEGLSWWETGLGATWNSMKRAWASVPQTYNQAQALEYSQDAADLNRGFGEILYDERTPAFDENGKELGRAWASPGDLAGAAWRYYDSRISGGLAALGVTDDPAAVAADYQMQAAEWSKKIADLPMSPGAQAVREKLGGISGDWQSQLSQFGALLAEDPSGFLSFIGQVGLESLPMIGVSAGVGVVTRNPTAAATTMGALSGAREYGSGAGDVIAEAGYDLTTPEGALAAISDETLMRRAGEVGQARGLVIGVLDGLSGGIAGKVLAENPVGNMMLQTLTQALFGSGGEGLAQFSAGQDLNLADILIEGLAEGVTAPAEVAGMAMSKVRQMQGKAQAAQDRVAMFQELSGQAVNSKLRARMPDRFRQFVDQATANGPVENVFVPATEFQRYFQEAGIDPYALVDELDGVTRDDLDAALAGGGDLRIPTAVYAAKIAGSEHDAFLMENMRFDPLDMTAREAAEFNSRADEIMQEMWAEAEDVRVDEERWRAVEEKIHDQVVSQMRAAGLSTERAMAEVQPIVAFYRTRAARMGLTTEEYLAKNPLPGIQGSIPEGMVFKDVDQLNRTLAEARNRRAPAADTRQSLLEFIDGYGGINDVGGELKARDVAVIKRGRGKKALKLARDTSGEGQASMLGAAADGKRYGYDDVAQAAIEAGFMADNPDVIAYKASLEDGTQAPDISRALFDAIDAELRGQKQASEQDAAPIDEAALDEIEAYLNRLGLDLNNSDEEIRAAIEADQASGDRMYGQDGQIATESDAFKAWFGDSVVTDADGSPMVVYHGTRKAGFMVFDTDGAGKTAGTGAFFTESARGASTYSGTMREAKPIDVQMIVEDPGQYGFSVREDGGEWIATDANGNEYASADREQALTELADDWLRDEQAAEDGNYAVYLSIQNPKVIDAGGQNWDSIGAEPEYFVQNEDGEVIEYFTSKEDADLFAEQNEEEYGFLEVVEEKNTDFAASTDDLVRQARDEGYDGVIFENITDEGPFGQGYGWDNKIFVAFAPTQIKSVFNRGTFDPNDARVLYQDGGQKTSAEFQKMISGARDRIAQRNTTADQIAAAGKPVVMSNGVQRAMIGPNTIPGEKPFRVTYMGADGQPNGHVEAATLRDAAVRAMEDGFAPDRSYQQAQDQDRPLYVVHNLSAEKLRKAAEIGGLAAPSLAVARGDVGFDSFGEISLIGAPSLADPKTNGVRLFSADVYSPRQPRARFKVDSKAAREMNAVLGPVAEKLGFEFDGVGSSEIERDGLSAIEGQMIAKVAWMDSLGETVPVVREAPEPAPVPVPGFEAFTSTDWRALRGDPAFAEAVAALYRNMAEGRAAVNPALAEKILAKAFDADGSLNDDRLTEQAQDVARRNQSIRNYKPMPSGRVDRYRTSLAIDEQIGNRSGEFNAWVRGQFGGVITDMFFENEAGRKKEYTLANLVREMTRTIRNGETWNYGSGNVRAAVAPEFKSLSEVKAARGQITDDKSMEALKDEVNSELLTLADKFAPYAGSEGKRFGWGDTFSEFLRDVAKGPRAVAEWSFSGNVPADLMDEAVAFLEKLKSLPTNYFEIKMQRAMEFSEFTAALVPSNLPDDARQILTDAGLELVEYQRGDDGAGRNAALQQIGPRVFFQNQSGPRGQISFNMDGSSLIRLFETANLSTLQHEMGHLFLTMLQRDAATGDAGSVAELETVKGWWRENAAAVAADANRARGVRSKGEYRQVSPDQARQIDMATELPSDPLFAEAVQNTAGAEISDDGLLIDLVRWQKPEQEGETSVRTGVFYLPVGSANARHYKVGGTGGQWYGGPRQSKGQTLIKRPLFVKGATGGKAPEAAFDAIKGKGASKKLNDAAKSAATAPKHMKEEVVYRFLEEYGADADMAWEIIENSQKGNQLTYALQENVVAHAVREAGYDSVIGYSKGKAGAMISEVFDVREVDYPTPGKPAALHPEFDRRSYNQSGQPDFNDGDATVTAEDVQRAIDTGTSGDSLKDFLIDVGMQEQWARGYEAYLMEGKAPSVELRSAFEKFRSWMISVYRKLIGLNVQISPEIKGVFDRMLATDEEIAKAQQSAGGDRAVFTTAEQMGLTQEEFERFLKLRVQAEDEAKMRLQKEIMAPIQRQKEQWFKDEKAKVEDEVTRQVNAMPVFRAMEWLGNRRWLGGDAPEAMPDMRMSKDTLVARYGEGVLKTLPRGMQTVYAVEGGMDPDSVAGWFGFDSGDQMIRAMERAPKRGDAIRDETARVMNERHGDALNDGEIEAIALDVLHSDKRGMWIAAELKAVVDVAGRGVGLTLKDARATARQTVARMRVKDATAANRFLAAERKASEEAARLGATLAREKLWADAAKRKVATKARAALRDDGTVGAVSGQIERANSSATNYNETVQKFIAAKRRQLMNHALFMEARDVADEVAKAERFVKGLGKASMRERIAGAGRREGAQTDYLAAIDEIVERYDFRKLSGPAEQRKGALLAFVDAMKAAGRENELAIPEAVLRDAMRKPYRTLTVEELRGVVDSLKNLSHIALRWNDLIDAKNQRKLDEAVADISTAFDANMPKRPPGRVKTSGEGFRNSARQFLDLVLNASTLLREIDGFKDNGAAYANIKSPIDEAMDRLTLRKEKAAADMEALYAVYSKEDRRRMAVREYMPALGYSLSKWEKIAVALNTGNDGNMQRLTDPKVRGSLTEAQVRAVLASLDERDAAFVQSVWDYVGSFRDDIAAREKRSTGVEPQWVDPSPVQIAGKMLKGGYYPLKYDPRLSSLARDDEAQAIGEALQAGRFGKAQTKRGHLEARAKSSGRDVELDMSVFHRHINQVIYDLELSEPVANSWKVLQNSEIRQAFQDAGRQADFDALETWLKDVAEGQLSAGDWINKNARRLKSNFTAAKLAFNLGTVAAQVTGLSQTMVVVGKRDFVRGLQASFRPGVYDEVAAKSAFMRQRQTTFNKDISDFYDDPSLGPTASRWGEIKREWIGPASFWMMTKVQWTLVDVPTWLGGYQQGLRLHGNDEAKAIAHADGIVKRAQASGLFSDRSAIERGSVSRTTRQNDVIRLFTTLGSYMFAKFNVAYERSLRGSRVIRQEGLSVKSVQEAASMTLDMAFLFAVEAVVMAALRGKLPDDEDDDDPEWAAFLAKETAFSVLGTIPFVRDVASFTQGFEGGGAYGGIIAEIGKPFVEVSQGEIDKGFVKSVINGTGLMLGLPSSQINRAVDAAWRDAEGEDVAPIEYLLGKRGG